MLVAAVTWFDPSIVSLHVCNRVVETDGFKLSAHLSMCCSAASPVFTCCYINIVQGGVISRHITTRVLPVVDGWLYRINVCYFS